MEKSELTTCRAFRNEKLPFRRRLEPVRLSITLVGFSLLATAAKAFDQGIDIVRDVKKASIETDIGVRNGNFIVAPIPFSNDALGSGLAVGAGYLFSFEGSKPSGFGLGYIETTNGSNGYAFGGSFSLRNDRWTLGVFGADGQLYYDLPVSPTIDLPLSQSVAGGSIKLEYGFSKKLKAGLSLSYLESGIKLNSRLIALLPPVLQPDLDVELTKLSFDVVYDTRDSTFFPRSGYVASLVLSQGHIRDSIFNGRVTFDDRTYYKMLARYSGFRSVGKEGVVGVNAVLCGAESTSPFFDGCGVGFVDGLRGFTSLGSLADWSASMQIEYRGHLTKRFGYAVFAGTGAGGDGLGGLSFKNGGAAVGLGLRYRISKKFELDYTIDYAQNDNGEEFIYFSLGQRF